MHNSHRLERPRQRTFHDLDEAGPTARLLDVVEEPRRPVSGSSVRPSSVLALQTESRSTSMSEGRSREYREIAARGVQGFEWGSVNTIEARQRRCCSTSNLLDSRAGCRDSCCCWEELLGPVNRKVEVVAGGPAEKKMHSRQECAHAARIPRVGCTLPHSFRSAGT